MTNYVNKQKIIIYSYNHAYTRRSKIDEMVYAIDGALPQLS